MVRSVHGFHYAMFAVDEYSRFIFVEFLKTKEKREITEAVARIVSRFNATVDAGCDDQGPLPYSASKNHLSVSTAWGAEPRGIPEASE